MKFEWKERNNYPSSTGEREQKEGENGDTLAEPGQNWGNLLNIICLNIRSLNCERELYKEM